MKTIAALLVALVLAALTSITAIELANSGRSDPAPYSEDQLGVPSFRDALRPMTITLRIVSQRMFEAKRPTEKTLAFTITNIPGSRCEITIPVTMGEIVVYPAERVARWVGREAGDVLAHEILHCMRGGWHPR